MVSKINLSTLFLVLAAVHLLFGCMQLNDSSGAKLVIVAPQSLFGAVRLGQNKTLSFSITNQGGFDATKISVASVDSPFTIETNTCGSELPMGKSCDIAITFAPMQIRSFEQTFFVSFFDGQSDQKVEIVLQGNGTEGGEGPPP